MSPNKLSQYQAYATANQTAPKTRQIVMLYDGAINYLRQAREAIEAKEVEKRYHLLLKASDIMLGLQGCLDFDSGGDVARALYDYYSSMDSRIISIHRSQSAAMCETLIGELKQMRDAWSAIDQRVEQAAGEVLPAPQASAPEETIPPAGNVEISA